MPDYVPGDKAEILKVRIGNGDSAIDVEWDDENLCWTVQARAFNAFWFVVRDHGEGGYKRALREASSLESLLQRMKRYQAEADGAHEEVRVFIQQHRAEDKGAQCA